MSRIPDNITVQEIAELDPYDSGGHDAVATCLKVLAKEIIDLKERTDARRR